MLYTHTISILIFGATNVHVLAVGQMQMSVGLGFARIWGIRLCVGNPRP